MADVAQLLSNLHPMREPSPPAAVMPYVAMLAVGAAIAAAGFLAWHLVRRRGAGLRRSARAALDATRGLDPQERLLAQARLLRRLVRARSGDGAARLQGESWLATLDRSFATTIFTRGEGRAYAEALYSRAGAADVEALDRALEALIASLGRSRARGAAA